MESRPGRLDVSMLLGAMVVFGAIAMGIGRTGISLAYFLQPTGFFIVIVGTIGVTILTTPRADLARAARRIADLLWPQELLRREEIVEEIVSYTRLSRTNGLLSLEAIAPNVSSDFLEEALLFALDVKDRVELQSALEGRVRRAERQGDADARVLETAGGFAPTIGVLGTVIGLVDALRRFADLSSVASGMGIAFVSTVYGLALANLVLLPLASRIRARVDEAFEIEALMTEGVLCVFDGLHPQLVRQRLACFRSDAGRAKPVPEDAINFMAGGQDGAAF